MSTTIAHRITVLSGVYSSRPALHRLAVDEIEQEIGSEVDSRVKLLWDANVSLNRILASINEWLDLTYGRAPDGITRRVSIYELRLENDHKLAFRLSLAIGSSLPC